MLIVREKTFYDRGTNEEFYAYPWKRPLISNIPEKVQRSEHLLPLLAAFPSLQHLTLNVVDDVVIPNLHTTRLPSLTSFTMLATSCKHAASLAPVFQVVSSSSAASLRTLKIVHVDCAVGVLDLDPLQLFSSLSSLELMTPTLGDDPLVLEKLLLVSSSLETLRLRGRADYRAGEFLRRVGPFLKEFQKLERLEISDANHFFEIRAPGDSSTQMYLNQLKSLPSLKSIHCTVAATPELDKLLRDQFSCFDKMTALTLGGSQLFYSWIDPQITSLSRITALDIALDFPPRESRTQAADHAYLSHF